MGEWDALVLQTIRDHNFVVAVGNKKNNMPSCSRLTPRLYGRFRFCSRTICTLGQLDKGSRAFPEKRKHLSFRLNIARCFTDDAQAVRQARSLLSHSNKE